MAKPVKDTILNLEKAPAFRITRTRWPDILEFLSKCSLGEYKNIDAQNILLISGHNFRIDLAPCHP